MNGTPVRRSPGRKGTPQAESNSKLPRSVAEVLKEHVELELESIDRMYLNVFVPRLQIVEGALRFIKQQRGSKVLSTSAVEPMTRGFIRAIEQFAEGNEIPVVHFEKGQRKDDIATRGGLNSRSPKESSSSAKLRRRAGFTALKNATIQKPTRATHGSSSPRQW